MTDHGALVDGSYHFPTAQELANVDVMVMYKGDAGYMTLRTMLGGQPSRAFVWMQGHTYTNFARPEIQGMLLRAIAWAGHYPVESLLNVVRPARGGGRGGRGGRQGGPEGVSPAPGRGGTPSATPSTPAQEPSRPR